MTTHRCVPQPWRSFSQSPPVYRGRAIVQYFDLLENQNGVD